MYLLIFMEQIYFHKMKINEQNYHSSGNILSHSSIGKKSILGMHLKSKTKPKKGGKQKTN